jgi:serine/threonine-protein kinase
MKTVITIHGIKTRGKWQKEIVPFLEDGGFRHEPLDFGNFLALQLAREKSRLAQIEWFRDEYTRIVATNELPSVIAHSFGTYVVARALELYPEIKFDRIIFCGSIVSDHFDWEASREQFSEVLNDCGKRDFWSWVSRLIVKDAGPSGVSGFKNLAAGAVQNRIHREFRHSDFFTS